MGVGGGRKEITKRWGVEKKGNRGKRTEVGGKWGSGDNVDIEAGGKRMGVSGEGRRGREGMGGTLNTGSWVMLTVQRPQTTIFQVRNQV